MLLKLIHNDNALTGDKSCDMLKQRRCMIETMKRFEAVIFDMDGVIFDSELLVIKCWQVVADKYEIKNIEDTCHKCLGLNKDATKRTDAWGVWSRFFGDETQQGGDVGNCLRTGGEESLMKPGVTGLLQTLKRMEERLRLPFYQESSCRTGSFGMQVSFRISIGLWRYGKKRS